MRYSIFECAGDPAKDLMGTAVVAALKKADPERAIVVVTLHPEVWLHNPNVYRVYKFGQMSYFYDDYVKDKDSRIFRHDPYVTTDFAYGRKHVIDIWCELCGVKRGGALPSLHFTWREKEAAGKLTASVKPLFFIQATGSLDPHLAFAWQRDIPLRVAEEVVAKMNAKGYQSIQIKEGHHPALAGTMPLLFDLRLTLCAISFSKKRLFIDSSCLQAATAHGLHSVALYTTGSPKVTGYGLHTNIPAFSHLNAKGKHAYEKLIDFVGTYKEGYDLTGAMRLSPYDLTPLFDADRIVETLES